LTVFALAAVVMALCLSPASAQETAGPGERFEYCCCLKDRDSAEAYAGLLRQTVPGTRVDIEPIELSKQGYERTAYRIMISHPELDREELSARLIRTPCP
jgi:hypothetical protein